MKPRLRLVPVAAVTLATALAAGPAASAVQRAPARAAASITATSHAPAAVRIRVTRGSVTVGYITARRVTSGPAPLRARAAASPSTQYKTCTSGTGNWVRLHREGLPSLCVGYVGSVQIPANATYLLCPGNNYGTAYYDLYGQNYSFPFAPKYGYSGSADWYYYQIDITRYSGSSPCPE